MRARRNDRGLVGGGAAIVLLVLGLLLRAAPFGHDAPRAAAFALAFDPAGTICTAHPDPAGGPDDKDRPPAGSHDRCCAAICGAGDVPPPALPPGAGTALPPPERLGSARGRRVRGGPDARRRRVRHAARAPPGPA